jgi:uncharacterized protein (TIGR00375 family)
MKEYFADLHIHVGMSQNGKWIKIPTSRNLTVENILNFALESKGMELIGIVDALSPLVQADLRNLTEQGLLISDSGGGYRYLDRLTVLLGAEVETAEADGSLAHTLLYLPDLPAFEAFSQYMAKHIRNINLSSQNAHMPLEKLISIAAAFEAVIVPAHIFTPHKSLYGSCCRRLEEIITDQAMSKIAALEIGLSADSTMADRIGELADFTLVSNSDAHSLGKIAREYNILCLQRPDFTECVMAFKRSGNRHVAANYGLNPLLGKYHKTYCRTCGSQAIELSQYGTCPNCQSGKWIKGVADRIEEIADFSDTRHPRHRPPYFHQVPLEMIPGIGKEKLRLLLKNFSTEMNVLHKINEFELSKIVGNSSAAQIIRARNGVSVIVAGGGGIYGKLLK